MAISTEVIKVQLDNLIDCHEYVVKYKVSYTETNYPVPTLDKYEFKFRADKSFQNAFVLLTKDSDITNVFLEVHVQDLTNDTGLTSSSLLTCSSYDRCEAPFPTPSITRTNTPTPSITPTNTATPNNTPTPTNSVTPTNTVTPSTTPTNTVTPSTTPTNTVTPTVTTSTRLIIAGNNSANYNYMTFWGWGGQTNVTTVGSNGRSSAYGTYDQTGSVLEWNDLDGSPGSSRGLRGGDWYNLAFFVSSAFRNGAVPSYENHRVGFRLASSVLNPLDLSNFELVGDAGNTGIANPSNGALFGSVSTAYRIGKYKVTNCEYVAFLNAVDPEGINPEGIYNSNMNSDPNGGITLVPSNADGQKYILKSNMDNKPVVLVSWFDCARYCNWLHNGMLTYNTTAAAANARNTGAYNVSTTTSETAVAKEAGANYYIPTEDEWYKAAYYKGGGTTAGYWFYATQSDDAPTPVTASSTGDGQINSQPARTTDYVCP